MLSKEFSKADLEVMQYLMSKQPGTNKSWLDFCRERGFTVDEMMKGFEWQQRRHKTIDHAPLKPRGQEPVCQLLR